MSALPTFEYSPVVVAADGKSQAAARRRLAAKRAALIEVRQQHPTESVTPAMMTKHYETALHFITNLDSGKLGQSAEDRAGALAVVLAGATAGLRASPDDRTLDERYASPEAQLANMTELVDLREKSASMRAGLESIREECKFAFDEAMPVTRMRNAVAFAHGVASRCVPRKAAASCQAPGETEG